MTFGNKAWLKIIVGLVILYFAVRLFLPTVNSNEFRQLVEDSKVWGVSAIMGYIILAHVIAPISGSPVVLLGVALFGIFEMTVYLYIASMISAAINFGIARHYGRPMVRRLAGEQTVAEIDSYLGASGINMLIIARIFGFAIFDIVSYAAGLSRVRFLRYYLITLFFPLFPMILNAFLFRNVDFTSARNLTLWTAGILVAGVLFGLWVRRYLKNKPKII